jgi:hypothetical protein
MTDGEGRSWANSDPCRRLWIRRVAVVLITVFLTALLAVGGYIRAGKELGEALIDLGYLKDLIDICGLDAGARAWWDERPMGPYCDYEDCDERLRLLCPEGEEPLDLDDHHT